MRVAASIIFSASSFISLVIMTRYVGESYGMMMWGMALVATFNSALDIGFHSANIKKISEGKDLNKCVSTYLAIRIVISAATICLVLLSSFILGRAHDGFPPEFWSVTFVFIAYFVLSNLLMVMNGTFTGHMNAGKESAVLSTEYIVRSVILIALAISGASAVVLSLGYIVGVICALVVAFILFRSLKVRLVRPSFFKEYASFVAPLALPLILIAVVGYVDKVMIGASYGELEVGIFTAAYGVVYSLMTIGIVMNGLLLSHMTKLLKEGRSEEARNTLWSAQKYMAILLMPATAFLLIFGNETAIVLFQVQFAPSGPVLSILAIGVYFTVLNGMLTQLLYSMDRRAIYGRSAIIYAVVTLILFATFIPGPFHGVGGGAEGAAISLVISGLLFSVLLSVAAKRIGTFGIYPRLYIHVAAAVAVMFILYMINEHLSPSGLPWMVVLAMLSVGVYSAILAAARELTPGDIAFIRETINIKNLYDDLRSEMKNDGQR